MVKVCYLIQFKTGVSYHRIEVPFASLNSEYKSELDIKAINGFTHDCRPEQFDVLVLNRQSTQPEPYIQIAKERGMKVILDLDDYWEIPEWHTAYDFIYTPLFKQKIIEFIHLADEIWVASEFLGEQITKEFGKPYVYIPNAIDFEQPQFIPRPEMRQNKLFTIGYVGAASHHLDLEQVIRPLAQLRHDKCKDDYALLLGGYNKEYPDYWKLIEQIMTSDGRLPPNQYVRIDSQNAYNYAVMYNFMDCAIAPLNDDIYSRCKSSLKILEAAAFGIPIICSNVEPYREFIQRNLVYHATAGWDKVLTHRIKQKGKHNGAELQAYVKEHYNIKTVNKLRYESIIRVAGNKLHGDNLS